MPTLTDRCSANRVFGVLAVAFALLFSSLVPAVRLTASVEVYDPAYISIPGNAIPPSMLGAELALINEEFAYEICRRIGARCTLRFVAFGEILPGPAVFDRGLGGSLQFALPKQRDELRRTVNQALATIRADGTFQRIVRQYLPLGLD